MKRHRTFQGSQEWADSFQIIGSQWNVSDFDTLVPQNV